MTWHRYSLALLPMLFAQAQPRSFALSPRSFTISIPGAGQNPAYTTTAWVVTLSARHSASIYALGRQLAAQKSEIPVASSFDDLRRDPNNAMVTNGGFSEDYGGQPAGLLLVRSRVVHSFAGERTSRGSLRLSGLLCEEKYGRLSILNANDYSAAPRTILDRCLSALQAGPLVVLEGKVGIDPSEMRSRRPEIRTIVATSKAGDVSFVVFTKPVHLYAAAAFIAGSRSETQSNHVRQQWVNGRLRTDVGLGLNYALNLDGSTSSVLAFQGNVLLGDARRLLPSAIAVRFH